MANTATSLAVIGQFVHKAMPIHFINGKCHINLSDSLKWPLQA